MYNNKMKIIKLNEVNSTHTYLKEYIKEHSYIEPLCIMTDNQSDGIGSRGNNWTGVKGNLFFSFVLLKDDLPKDLPTQSFSIYFSFLLKEVLKENASKIWLKWPNDFYIDDKKIGGTITTLSNNFVYCGIGLNLIHVDENFGNLDIKIDSEKILQEYFSKLNESNSWKQIFNSFKIEFENSRRFQSTIENQKVSLANAVLNEDGSIDVNKKKVFSLR